jgi:hypothetical protein
MSFRILAAKASFLKEGHEVCGVVCVLRERGCLFGSALPVEVLRKRKK